MELPGAPARENVVCPALGQNYCSFEVLIVLVKFVLLAVRLDPTSFAMHDTNFNVTDQS